MNAPEMQPLNREAIFAALFTRLQTIPGVKTFSRVLLSFEDACAADQPAIFLTKGDEENREPNRSLPAKWKLSADITLFCRNDADPHAGPSIQLNTLLSAIEGVLIRQPFEGFKPGQPFAQTNDWWTSLDGLCSHCWISDRIIIGEGANGLQAVAVVPIEIYTTP